MFAEEANLGKTRFLAAAGHDILQPLNAARLYCASLIEKAGKGKIQKPKAAVKPKAAKKPTKAATAAPQRGTQRSSARRGK